MFSVSEAQTSLSLLSVLLQEHGVGEEGGVEVTLNERTEWRARQRLMEEPSIPT